MPARYNSSRAKCIKCSFCRFFAPKSLWFEHFFVQHLLLTKQVCLPLSQTGWGWEVYSAWCSQFQLLEATHQIAWRPSRWGGARLGGCEGEISSSFSTWFDQAMFNGGTRKRMLTSSSLETSSQSSLAYPPLPSTSPTKQVKLETPDVKQQEVSINKKLS